MTMTIMIRCNFCGTEAPKSELTPDSLMMVSCPEEKIHMCENCLKVSLKMMCGIKRKAFGHDLYKTGDEDAPDSIKDRNGEVVLNLCRNCGLGEAELSGPCAYKIGKMEK